MHSPKPEFSRNIDFRNRPLRMWVSRSTVGASSRKSEFTANSKSPPTYPELRVARQQPLPPDAIRLRQCTLGELCSVPTASRPNICACLARLASKINSVRGSDAYCINELAKTGKAQQQAAVLNMPSRLILGRGRVGMSTDEREPGGGRIHCGTMSPVRRSDAANGGKSAGGICRLDYGIGLTLSTLNRPCHVLQWASKSTSALVKSDLGGEVYALSEMVGHMSLKREFRKPPQQPGEQEDHRGNVDCPPFSGDSAVVGELGSANWLPGLETPAAGSIKVESGMVPPLRLMESFDRCVESALKRVEERRAFLRRPPFFLP